jgi:hypothetical protein
VSLLEGFQERARVLTWLVEWCSSRQDDEWGDCDPMIRFGQTTSGHARKMGIAGAYGVTFLGGRVGD